MESSELICLETMDRTSTRLRFFKRKTSRLIGELKDIFVTVIFSDSYIDLRDKAGQSSQMDFYLNDTTARDDKTVVTMHHGWTSKKVSEQRFKNTHDALFNRVETYVWNENRAKKLV
jgi:hypothetical protein